MLEGAGDTVSVEAQLIAIAVGFLFGGLIDWCIKRDVDFYLCCVLLVVLLVVSVWRVLV